MGLRARMRRTAKGSIAALLLVVSPLLPQGLTPASGIGRRYGAERWTTEDGLPGNAVPALVQTREGYLWCGTFGGLVRFDGVQFRVFDIARTPGFPSNRIVALLEDHEGALWIGTQGSGLVRSKDGRFDRFTAAEGLPCDFVWSLAEDGRGELYVGTERGLARRSGERFVAVRDVDGRLEGSVTALARSLSGALWATGGVGLWRVEDAMPRHVESVQGMCALEDGSGRLWIGTGGGLRVVTEAGVRECRGGPVLERPVWRLLQDGNGVLWVGGDGGLARIEDPAEAAAGGVAAGTERPESPTAVRSLLEDREGNVWVGWNGEGITRLRAAQLEGWTFATGFPTRAAQVLTPDGEGGLWIGTFQSLVRWGDGRFSPPQRTRDGRQVPGCDALFRDADGTLWIGNVGGLFRFVDGRLEEVEGPGAAKAPITAIHRDRQGRLWAGGSLGLYVLEDGRLVPAPGTGDLAIDGVHCIVEDQAGALWIGTTTALVSVRDGRFEALGLAEGLPFGDVRDVFEDAAGTLWIATYGGGLCRLRNGRIAVLAEEHGLPDNSLSRILASGDRLVVNGNRGVFMCALDDLNGVADGRLPHLPCQLLDPAPAMRSGEGNGGSQPAGCRAEDGSFWFPTIEGVVRLDGMVPSISEVPPIPVIEGASAGSRSWPASGRIVAPAGTRGLAFQYSGPTFRHPSRARFRYRLEGVDQDWVDAGTRREAFYSNVPPGAYRFELMAANADGVWCREPAVAEIEVLPELWETAWFRLSSAGGIVLLGLGLVRLASRREAARSRQLATLVASRTRELEDEVAERRRVETELRAAQENLEERVRQRTAELARTLKKLRDDMRERERLEKQFLQSQKLESVGRLAGGVAHDFNNLLTVVLGCSALLEEQLPPDGELAGLVRQIQRAGERAGRLTNRLLTFARRQVVAARVLDLNQVAVDLGAMLRRLIGEDVELEIRPAPGPVRIKADPIQIEQVLVNLCVNAREAMPGGGRLTVAIGTGGGPGADGPAAEDQSGGRHATLEVADTGVGMTPEVKERAFEPFFTTKEAAGGSGLGLATCYGIVAQLNGRISIDSEPGCGTRVRIVVPLTEEPVSRSESAEPEPVIGGRERILLVEDETDVRRVVRLMVEQIGYRVTDAPNGAEALRILRQDPDAFDLVLTDVVMPGLRGRQLVEQLRALRPDLPIVLMTGYFDSYIAQQGLLDSGLPIVQKPPGYATLASSIRQALDLARAAPDARPGQGALHAADGAA